MTALPRHTWPPRRRRAALLPVASIALFALAAAPDRVAADQPEFGPNDVPTAFFINKSDDHNRVDYGVRLDATCRPVGSEPVFPYWREFENAPPVRTHGLKWIERFVYGLGKQRIVRHEPAGAEITVRLKKLDREVVISTSRTPEGRCTSIARTHIGRLDAALLHSAYVKLYRPMSVEYVEIRGTDPDSGEPVTERLVP